MVLGFGVWDSGPLLRILGPCCGLVDRGFWLSGWDFRAEGYQGVASGARDLEGFYEGSTHRPLSSSSLGLPYRILNRNHKKELLRGPMGRSDKSSHHEASTGDRRRRYQGSIPKP